MKVAILIHVDIEQSPETEESIRAIMDPILEQLVTFDDSPIKVAHVEDVRFF